jgi:hypothetical protein
VDNNCRKSCVVSVFLAVAVVASTELEAELGRFMIEPMDDMGREF